MTKPENRCRLVLITPQIADAATLATVVGDALKGGDVASVIIPQYGFDDDAFQAQAEAVVPLVQAAGAAAIVADNSRVAGRAKADGLHVTGNVDALAEAVEKFTPKMIVGCGGAKDRHQALEAGDADPDYMFFGRFDGDIKPEAHSKNLDLAEWWSSMIEIPCIVMAGNDPQSALAGAETGAEFVALSRAVFDDPAAAATVVAQVNALLDEKAPRFEG
ncbi:thiamine phosphate synthase [Allorhizobium taibaishanense]|uniref:Thiamine phosphate synthase n=1 Tax=Allorhizobium taibaishanense TaxID=887144 RepID=A0A1Q9A4W8_9HYPH|nr:thiamine phosphate synthase [Allorhizobium taibaishanense]MBB4006683.1 thiamine-phosphate pyrophosphorylase [Allorhizobium taibaishanense]OLP49591.1 thiamine phosphate synthase [Allorhizobium taibaishanense]